MLKWFELRLLRWARKRVEQRDRRERQRHVFVPRYATLMLDGKEQCVELNVCNRTLGGKPCGMPERWHRP